MPEPQLNKMQLSKNRKLRQLGHAPIQQWSDIQPLLKQIEKIDISKLSAPQLLKLNKFYSKQTELTAVYYDEKAKYDHAWRQAAQNDGETKDNSADKSGKAQSGAQAQDSSTDKSESEADDSDGEEEPKTETEDSAGKDFFIPEIFKKGE